jgi:hypothetical protein
MTREAPAASGTTTTAAEVVDRNATEARRTPEERAQRARIVEAALRTQQAMQAAQKPPTPEAQAFIRTMSLLDRQPTAEQRAAEQEQAREAARVARNAKYRDAQREHAERVRASGYQGWTGGAD